MFASHVVVDSVHVLVARFWMAACGGCVVIMDVKSIRPEVVIILVEFSGSTLCSSK